MSAVTMLAVGLIRRDGGTQFRTALDAAIVEEYAALLRGDIQLPPVVVFYDGSSYWLADGFYRAAAHEREGCVEIACDVRSGTVRDARIYAATEANKGHGVRMSAAEKRACVLAVLQDEEGGAWSDREIARRCGVGYDLVAAVRSQLPVPAVEKGRKGKDGKVRKLPAKAPAPQPGKVLSDEELQEIEQRALYNRLSFEEAVERTKRIVAAGGQEALEADAARREEIRKAEKAAKKGGAPCKTTISPSAAQTAAPSTTTSSTSVQTTSTPPAADAGSPSTPQTITGAGKTTTPGPSGSLRDPVPEIAAQAAQMSAPYRPVLFPEESDGEQEALGWVAELLGLELDGATTVQVRQAIQVAIGRLKDTTDPDALKAAAARGYAQGEQEALGWVAEHCLQLPPFGAGPAAKLREEIEQAALHLRQPATDTLLDFARQAAREIGEERGAKAKRDALPPSAFAGPLHLLVRVQAVLCPGRDLPWEGESVQARKLWDEFSQSFLIARDKKADAEMDKRARASKRRS